MKRFNCFVKYAGRTEEYSMFIQIPKDVMNSSNPNSINSEIRKEIAKRHYGDGDFVKIVDLKVLGCYGS